MPVIVFSSSKGGAGKTTSSLVVSTGLARKAPVILIDADPNRPIRHWAQGRQMPPGLTLVTDANEDNIISVIDEARTRAPFVVVDMEGTASKIILLATTRADLVVIPTQGSQLDAQQSAKTISAVRQAEQVVNRTIPARVLFTRTNPQIRTRTLSFLKKDFLDRGVPVLKSELHEREAFRAMFSFRQTLQELNPDDVANIDKAIANADELVSELVRTLRETGQPADRVSAPQEAQA